VPRRLCWLCGFLGISMLTLLVAWTWKRREDPPSMQALSQIGGPIYIVRVEPVREESFRAFAECLAAVIRVEVQATDRWRVDERHLLSWEGDLYDVDGLLDQIVSTIPKGARVIGVTDQPMHDEDHWWLYGKGGRAAVVSTAHLWRDEWSEARDVQDSLFRERLAKVGVHELGHCLGFQHCEQPHCVMWFSTELWMLDRSGTVFCQKCLRGWLSWNSPGG